MAALALFSLLLSCAARQEAPQPHPAPPTAKGAEEAAVETTLEARLLLSDRELWDRGLDFVGQAQKLRKEKSRIPVMGGIYGSIDATAKYIDLYSQALEEFAAIIMHYPESELAPEAQFMLGLVNDHPHLNNFEDAILQYRKTTERYPRTKAAEKASKRIKVLEEIRGGLEQSPHDMP